MSEPAWIPDAPGLSCGPALAGAICTSIPVATADAGTHFDTTP
ncbi:hypothetical protein [Nocardia sp. NBC_01388]